jgi:choline-glycine betaine transporter
MGLFLARISYGRTIREFMIINWILPSVFGIIWFAIWGGTGLTWQMAGVADMVGVIKEQGAVAGVWVFLQHLPFGIGAILIPIVMFTLVLSFSTAADSMTSTVAALCVKGEGINEEAPGYLKIAWGMLIGSISVILGAYAGGVRGIDGVRQLAAVGGFLVLFVIYCKWRRSQKFFSRRSHLMNDNLMNIIIKSN